MVRSSLNRVYVLLNNMTSPLITITVTWSEGGEGRLIKREAFSFESAGENLWKLERAYQQRMSDSAFTRENEDEV